jgi:hypothetical protein
VPVSQTWARCSERTGEPTLRDLSAALVAVYGTDYGIHSLTSYGRVGWTEQLPIELLRGQHKR